MRVEGLDQLRKTVRAVGDRDLQKALMAANKTAAQVVVSAALPKVPVRTGRLRASVKALGSQKSGRAVAGGGKVAYGPAVHYGRKRGNVGREPGNHPGANPTTAQPFLQDAAADREGEVVDVYGVEIDKVMDLIRRVTA